MHIGSTSWFGCFWSPCCVWFFTNFTCGGKLLQLIFPNIEIENCRVLAPFALMATPQTHHERVELMLLLLSVLVLCCCTVVLVLWQDGWMDAAAAQLWLCVCVWAVAPTFHILLSNQFLCSAQKCNQISLFMHHHHTFNDAACPAQPYVLNFCLFNFKLEMLL